MGDGGCSESRLVAMDYKHALGRLICFFYHVPSFFGPLLHVPGTNFYVYGASGFLLFSPASLCVLFYWAVGG